MKYDEVYCRKILKKNGWKVNLLKGHQLPKDWVSLAINLAILEKLDDGYAGES
ncbi:hypothetical protein LCGC14_1860450 [marine sediment metagenome]|uniref:Uncharacterized protein n=1 Tax=marine sediment metagenome TaxID=412755 RepID=A0A0F9IM59_9ZZZZ